MSVIASRKVSIASPASAVVTWLGLATVAGMFSASRWGGHGSIVIVMFAVAFSLVGAAAAAFCFSAARPRSWPAYARVLLTWGIASVPVLALSIWGLFANDNYSVQNATSFLAAFTLPGLAIAIIADWVASRFVR